MNLAIHGLASDIKQGNTYYEDLHNGVGKFDFTMANPPFNVDNIDAARIQGDPRFPYGLPMTQKGSITSGNYIWAQIFLSSLAPTGRSGFVMANSASDAGNAEKEIRKQMIEDGVVDVMVAVGPNMFYNVTLPVTLWFFDKNKQARKDTVLFIDARAIYTQIDKAHRKWSDEQIQQIAEIVRSYRGEKGSKPYADIKGLCKVATIEEVRAAGYSLNPGRYVGVVESTTTDEDFETSVKALHAEFLKLTKEAHLLEKKISENLEKIL
jgi:type I restriction enzyme M protein